MKTWVVKSAGDSMDITADGWRCNPRLEFIWDYLYEVTYTLTQSEAAA